MKLIYEDPNGRTNRTLFPFVGEWQTGEVKDVEDPIIVEFLLKHHGAFIHEYEKPTSKKKKNEIIEELPINELAEATKKATKKLESFYKTKNKGGEV